MNKLPTKTRQGELVTQMILETFRLNGLMLTAGDRLTKDLNLSSALWQVMGSIREEPLHLAQIARNMGLTRQSVRRSAQVLEQRGFAYFTENPNHKRAKLLALTDKGRQILSQVGMIYTRWSNELSQGLNTDDLSCAVEVMKAIGEKLLKRA